MLPPAIISWLGPFIVGSIVGLLLYIWRKLDTKLESLSDALTEHRVETATHVARLESDVTATRSMLTASVDERVRMHQQNTSALNKLSERLDVLILDVGRRL